MRCRCIYGIDFDEVMIKSMNREKIGSPVETLMGLSSKVERKEISLNWIGLRLKSW
jgi:hypothetical protein